MNLPHRQCCHELELIVLVDDLPISDACSEQPQPVMLTFRSQCPQYWKAGLVLKIKFLKKSSLT